jgi:hypothetical protein
MRRKLFGLDVVIWATGKVEVVKDGVYVKTYLRPQRKGYWSSIRDCK